jgi:hypothetical protein
MKLGSIGLFGGNKGTHHYEQRIVKKIIGGGGNKRSGTVTSRVGIMGGGIKYSMGSIDFDSSGGNSGANGSKRGVY